MRVYEATRAIPRGKVASYRGIARRIGCGSCQAVGMALSRNPFAPEVPCHRVVRSDGSPGGFNGMRDGAEPTRKRALLAAEGVFIGSDGRIAKDFFWEECG